MAFSALTYKAHGIERDEPVTKKFRQMVKLSFTRTTNTDGNFDLSVRDGTANSFWADVANSAAQKLWADVITKAENVLSINGVQVISGQAHRVTIMPANYLSVLADADVAVARSYQDATVAHSGSSKVDFDISLYDAASGSTAIACEFWFEFILKDGESPILAAG